jgi:hypothetical protein
MKLQKLSWSEKHWWKKTSRLLQCPIWEGPRKTMNVNEDRNSTAVRIRSGLLPITSNALNRLIQFTRQICDDPVLWAQNSEKCYHFKTWLSDTSTILYVEKFKCRNLLDLLVRLCPTFKINTSAIMARRNNRWLCHDRYVIKPGSMFSKDSATRADGRLDGRTQTCTPRAHAHTHVYIKS